MSLVIFCLTIPFSSDLGRSVFRILKYNPQALQMGCPAGFRRQSGVVVVPQFTHLVAGSLGVCPALVTAEEEEVVIAAEGDRAEGSAMG